MEKAVLIMAAMVLTLHGLMELAPLSFLFRSKSNSQDTGKGIPRFIFEPLQNNMRLTMTLGVIFGFLRVIAAIGIVTNFMWAWVLGVFISGVTLTIMTFYLPMGIVDGVLSGLALISLLMAYWSNQPIL